MNHNPNTMQSIAEIKAGIRVGTGTLLNASYLITGGTQTELFDVVGRIFLYQLYMEFQVACSANATQIKFNATWTTPVIAAADLCTKCASVSALARGRRVVWINGGVATAAVITASAGISDSIATAPYIVGGYGMVGTIGINVTDATQTSGSFRTVLHYVPASDGAYVTAKL
jgi:hypothetical protein